MHGLWNEIVGGQSACEPMSLEWLKGTHAALCDADDQGAGRYRKRDTSPGVYHLDVPRGRRRSRTRCGRAIRDPRDRARRVPPRCAPRRSRTGNSCGSFPFDERTGIVGRLLTNALLARGGYPPAVIHSAQAPPLLRGRSPGRAPRWVAVVAEACAATVRAADSFSNDWAAPAAARGRALTASASEERGGPRFSAGRAGLTEPRAPPRSFRAYPVAPPRASD